MLWIFEDPLRLLVATARYSASAALMVLWSASPMWGASQTSGTWAVEQEPTMRVGWATDEPDTEFFDVVGVARLPDGAMAIADRGISKVTVVEGDGSVRFALGGSGEGPGEFGSLIQVFTDDRGHIYGFDSRQQRLTEWTAEGDLVGTRTLSRAAAGRRLDAVGRFANGGWYVREAPRLLSSGVGGIARDTVGYFRIDQDGIVGEKLAEVPGIYATQATVGGQVAIRHIMFSPRALESQMGDCLLTMASDVPRISVIAAGGEIRGVIPLSIPVRRTSIGDRRLWIEGMIQSNEAPPEAAAVIEEMGRELVMAENWPVANRIIADDAGYVWVERFAAPEGPSEKWLALDGTGDVAAEPTVPAGLRLLSVSGDHVIGVWSDELGRQEVRVHTLTRPSNLRGMLPSQCQ